MSLPVALPPGTIIGGHYIIGTLLNSGGFGAVYRGIDTSEGNRPCAIKETYDVTPAARRQALMEASVLFTVRSEHLPEVYDALEANGRFYLVMQLIEGQNLLQLLKSRLPDGRVGESEPYRQPAGPCSEQEVLDWLLPIMDVLQELHSRNPPIIHRDIKPGNIILTPQRTTVLVDFGLTKLYDPARVSQTMVKAVSEGFSPLEQYVGKTSPQSDVYSMAATMYLLLTNRLPPVAVSRTVRDELIPPRLLNPLLSPKTERALLKALALNAEDRYQSMRAFAAALREPAFTGYADPTVSVPPVPAPPVSQGINTGATVAVRPTPGGTPHHPNQATQSVGPAAPGPNYYGYYGPVMQGPPPYPLASPTPASQGQGQPTPGAKGRPAKAPPIAPTQRLQRPRDLPSPSNQGCLWGLIQGIVCALLALSAKQATDVFLPVLVGALFYLFAGFITTRRGGGPFRGALAGAWTGIVGTTVFWVAYGIGLLVLVIRRIQELSATVAPDKSLQQAWASLKPVWPGITLLPRQSPFTNLLTWLACGLFVAWLLGLIGGLIGTSHHSARLEQQRQQQTPNPAQAMPH